MADAEDTNVLVAQQRAQIARQETELADARAEIDRYRALFASATYLGDELATWNKSVDFLSAPKFASAYRRGMNSGHKIGRAMGKGDDIGMSWRVAICCWAAAHAKHLAGDFVECGTNTGILSLAICDYVDFNATGKAFWLFDTFAGIPLEQMTERERAANAASNEMYFDCYERALQNFAPFPAAHLVRGQIPESLPSVDIDRVSYLSIDLNIEYPERAALEFFWPKLIPGGIAILDDYGWLPHSTQRHSHDEFAYTQGVEIFALPTGQGLLLKP